MKSQTTATLHPSPDELQEFALGSLENARAAIVEGHVYRCDRCAEVVAATPSDDFLQQLQASSKLPSPVDKGAKSNDSQETTEFALDSRELARVPTELRQHPRYDVRRLIAEGAMGRVYLANKRDTAEFIALKLMRPEIAGDQRKLNRFLQESRIAAKLRHPNIAYVLGCEPLGHTALIAMEFVRGKTLAQMVRRKGPLPVDESREIIRQVATGLAFAAQHGVVHRDIKPHNLMFEPHQKLVKIVDFGLGKLVDEQRTGSRLTRPDEILGTLDYISPEQAANSRDADERSDIYSLGCTLYFLLAGTPPFNGKNAVDLLIKHESEQPVPIQGLRRDVPKQLSQLLDRMMQKDPSSRPQTMHLVLKELSSAAMSGSRRSDSQTQRLENAGVTSSLLGRVLQQCASPVVWLPILTCVLSSLWLLFR